MYQISFLQRVQEAFAAVMRVVLPLYCVRVLTQKSRKDPWLYLPGTEKELQAIEKYEIAGSELAARVWSLGTKVALLKRGIMPLLSEIKTEEEFSAVLEHGDVRHIAQAMKVYTPSKAKMREVLALDAEKLSRIAEVVPAAFDTVMPWEILCVATESTPCPADNPRWKVAKTLAARKAAWAPGFMKMLWNMPPRQGTEKDAELFKYFFNIAYDKKEDISDLMAYMCVFYPTEYAKIRENYYLYEDFSAYFCKIFPQMLKHLAEHDEVKDPRAVAISGRLDDWTDAYAWLSIGYNRLSNPKIFACVLSHLAEIKERISEEAFDQLFAELVRNAAYVSDVKQLLSYGMSVYTAVLRKKLVSFEAPYAFVSFFPFKDWDEAVAKKALRSMAMGNTIPVNRLNELSPELQDAAKEEMEISAQVMALQKEDVYTLVANLQFHPRAELFLLERVCTKAVLQYMERVKMADSSVSFILSGTFSEKLGTEVQSQLIFAYAKRWGLSAAQYVAVLQSPIKSKAVFLKAYLREEKPAGEAIAKA